MKKDLLSSLPKVGAAVVLVGLISACAPETKLLTPGQSEQPVIVGLSNTDFEKAATEAIQSMLSSGAVDRTDGKKHIMVVSNILNDTMQRIDTDQLVKKIRVELLRSGKVKTTTAIGLNGAEDQMNAVYSQLEKSKKINRDTLVKQSLTAPNLSLSGKIIQRNNRTDSGKQLVEYYFQLSLTDLSDGLAIWEGETPIRKLTGSDSVSW